jgi:uncharacterized damage-inducible protein DinB
MARRLGETPRMTETPVHPLVDQLRFMRSELRRGVGDTSEDDGRRRVEPMNSIGWIVAHMAWQEQRQWLVRGQGLAPIRPDLEEIAPNGGPATTPSLRAVLDAYAAVTNAADPWLDGLRERDLLDALPGPGPHRTVGSALLRVVYHGWFHTGEIVAIRQILGHREVPEFAGRIDEEAPYRRA